MTAPNGRCEQCLKFRWELEAYIGPEGLVERWVCGGCGRVADGGEASPADVQQYSSEAEARAAKIPGASPDRIPPPEAMPDYVATCQAAVAKVEELVADARLVWQLQTEEEERLKAATILGLAEKLLAKRQAELVRAVELRRRADLVVKLGRKLGLAMGVRWKLTRMALQEWSTLTDRQWNKRLKDWHTAQVGGTVEPEGAEK